MTLLALSLPALLVPAPPKESVEAAAAAAAASASAPTASLRSVDKLADTSGNTFAEPPPPPAAAETSSLPPVPPSALALALALGLGLALTDNLWPAVAAACFILAYFCVNMEERRRGPPPIADRVRFFASSFT
jgi:hypothetical protein